MEKLKPISELPLFDVELSDQELEKLKEKPDISKVLDVSSNLVKHLDFGNNFFTLCNLRIKNGTTPCGIISYFVGKDECLGAIPAAAIMFYKGNRDKLKCGEMNNNICEVELEDGERKLLIPSSISFLPIELKAYFEKMSSSPCEIENIPQEHLSEHFLSFSLYGALILNNKIKYLKSQIETVATKGTLLDALSLYQESKNFDKENARFKLICESLETKINKEKSKKEKSDFEANDVKEISPLKNHVENTENSGNKKYKISTEEEDSLKIDTDNRKIALHRIIALQDIVIGSKVIAKKGEKGGYIQSEKNLSTEGACWIAGDALVCENAIVQDDSFVDGEAEVYGNAKITGNSIVTGKAEVYGDAKVTDSQIKDNAEIYGDATVNASQVIDNAEIFGDAELSYATVSGKEEISSSQYIEEEQEEIPQTPWWKDEDERKNVVETLGKHKVEGSSLNTISSIFEGLDVESYTLDKLRQKLEPINFKIAPEEEELIVDCAKIYLEIMMYNHLFEELKNRAAKSFLNLTDKGFDVSCANMKSYVEKIACFAKSLAEFGAVDAEHVSDILPAIREYATNNTALTSQIPAMRKEILADIKQDMNEAVQEKAQSKNKLEKALDSLEL